MFDGKLGFVGAGQMATALARGLVQAQLVAESQIVAYDPAAAARQAFQTLLPGITLAENVGALAKSSDVLVLAVKPQHMASATAGLAPVAGKLIISVAAGVRLEELAQLIGHQRLIRVMPNTPCLIGRGAAGYARGQQATDDDVQLVESWLQSLGVCVLLPEPMLDAVTGLSGSGPAFVAMFIEALSDGGVRMGLPREVATQLAAQTVLGAAQLVLDGRHPAQLKEQVASPGGTTIAGIAALEQGGFRSSVISAVVAATERARELGG